jgi:hypothetical protein
MIVKRKREEFKKIEDAEERKRHDETLLLMHKTQQIAADATRAQEKADQDAARAQKRPIKTLPGPKKKSMKTLQEHRKEQSVNKKI